MKWIGQHIWDFISRFRTTVYLENLETSSETNVLVVDSDGKVTKNSSASGDITGVTITTDTGLGGVAIQSSGSANFNILGSSGVGVTNSGTTITAVSVPGEIDHDSLLNFVTAEHYDWSSDISGTATVHTNNITDLHGAGVDGTAAGAILTDDADGTVSHQDKVKADSAATTGAMLSLDAGSVTSGQGVKITDATYERGSHLHFDITDTNTTNLNRSASAMVHIDYERPVGYPIASGQTVNTTAIDISMDDNATNVGSGDKTGLNIKVDSASNGGTVNNYGIVTNVGGADTNYDIKMFNFADITEYATLNCYTGGALDIKTVSDDSTGHLNLVADGDMFAKIPDQKEFSIVNTDGSGGTSHKFTSEVGAESHFYMYPSGGGVSADYFHIEIGQDGDTTLSTVDGVGTSADLNLSANGRFQVNTTDVDLYMGNYASQEAGDISFRSSTTFKPQLILESNANDNKPPSIKFLKDKGAAGADDDYVGTIKFSGDNTAQEETDFAQIRGRIATAGDTDESGYLYIGVAASNGTTSSIKDAITLTGGGLDNNVNVELGYGDGDVEFKRRKFTKTGITPHFDVQGDILYLGDGSTTQGDLCYLKENGEWGQADADGAATGDDADRDAMGMLAIALGTDPDADGMLIRGTITMDYDCGDCGNPIYVSTTAGDMTNTAPTASGDFVRVVGYCLDDTNGQIYFNPDNTWVEIA